MLRSADLDCQLLPHALRSVDAKSINQTPRQWPCLHMGMHPRGGRDFKRQQVFRINKSCRVSFVISEMM